MSAAFFLLIVCRFDNVEELREQAQRNVESDTDGLCFLDGGADILAIRATSYQRPTYCRLSNLATVFITDNQHWDIGAQRFNLYSNSGDSHQMGRVGGQGGVCLSPQSDYDTVAIGDCTNFVTDQQTEIIGVGGIPTIVQGSPALASWYDYDISQHVLMAKSQNYLLRSGEDPAIIYKIQFLDYYSDVGTPGYIRVRFARL